MEESKNTPKSEAVPHRSNNNRILVRAKKATVWILIGMLLGAGLLGAFRYFNLKDHHTHYHANFALYINGQRDEFKSPTYYEEVQLCGNDPTNPRARVHLHDMDAASVHVHDDGATWGALFANLGYTLGNDLLRTSSTTYINGLGGNLKFMLNGEQVVDIANRTIKDDDVLLVDYGSGDNAALKKEYDAIPRTAEEHDHNADPSTCSGSHPLTWRDRLKAAAGLN
jgi:hypothetical protein